MADSVTVAVDAQGGDHAPDEIVRGVAAVSLEAPHIQTILVGESARLTRLLSSLRHDPERIAVHHAGDFVHMDEKPRDALARPGCSIAVAAKLVGEGEIG